MSHSQQPILRRRTPRSQRSREGLIQYANNVHSQNGEDGILAFLFSLLPPASSALSSLESPTSTTRWCVDVGAWDGQHLSNTHELLCSKKNHPQDQQEQHPQQQQVWKGILLEADTEKFAILQQRYQDTDNICLQVTVSTTSPEDPYNLCNLLQHHETIQSSSFPKRFDFLCIDIDGSDYWVWHDLLQRKEYHAMVVCIEFNPTMPDDLIYIPSREQQRHGASLAALVELATTYQYVLVETTLYNAFFVPQEIYDQYLTKHVPDTSIEALHECTMGTSLYQLYDGTIKLWGCKKLLWHRITLDESKFQVLSEQERNFPFAPNNTASSTCTTPPSSSHHLWTDIAVDLKVPLSHSQNPSNLAVIAEQLLTRLEKDGFALVHGTGMDPHLCQSALEATHLFLHTAEESIRRSCLSLKDRARRGYAPMNSENFASLLGQSGPNDLVRKFRIGPIQPQQHTHSSPEPQHGQDALLQPNIWPPSDWEFAEFFQETMERYYESICTAATTVVKILCLGLIQKYPELEVVLQPLIQNIAADKPTNESGAATTTTTTATDTTTTTSILTLLGYVKGSRHKGKNKGPLVAAHTDVGVMTMLLFDGGENTCATLQRSDGKGGWVNVNLPSQVPPDPIFVINIADCLSDLTGRRLPSTIHRVVAQPSCSNKPRNCLALFVGLEPDCELMIDGEAMTYTEWRRRRIEKSQQVLKNAIAKP